jgi:hypothetical protein
MKTSLPRSFQVLTAVTCALLTGCTTTQVHHPVSASTVAPAVHVGDTVKCTLRDRSVAEFEVTAIESDALRGKSGSVATADITQIEITRFSGSRTALLVVGTALVSGALLMNGRNSLSFPGMGVSPR